MDESSTNPTRSEKLCIAKVAGIRASLKYKQGPEPEWRWRHAHRIWLQRIPVCWSLHSAQDIFASSAVPGGFRWLKLHPQILGHACDTNEEVALSRGHTAAVCGNGLSG